MARKKDDKRVLRSGNGYNPGVKRNRRIRKNNRRVIPRQYEDIRNRHNSNRSLVLFVIIALIAFIIGAGIGVSLSLDDGEVDDEPHYKNVTKQMTTDLNNKQQVYFDEQDDNVDFNENDSQLNIDNTTQK